MDKSALKERLVAHSPRPLGEQRRYAVFIPLVEIAGAWHVLYQVRSQKVSQAGEVSFPGGRVELGESPRQTAIREAVEELQVLPEQVEIWSEMDYIVYQDQTIECFVGQLQVNDWQALQPNDEVERLFVLSLKDLQEHPPVHYLLESQLDTANGFPFDRIAGGATYSFSHLTRSIPFYEDLPENLWGMTAQLTERFVEIICPVLIQKNDP